MMVSLVELYCHYFIVSFRYPLLLSRICKASPRRNPDREKLKMAQRRIEEQLNKINAVSNYVTYHVQVALSPRGYSMLLMLQRKLSNKNTRKTEGSFYCGRLISFEALSPGDDRKNPCFYQFFHID